MNAATFIGRVGGLAIALGIGVAIANGCASAAADSSSSTSNPSHSSGASSSAKSRAASPAAASRTTHRAGVQPRSPGGSVTSTPAVAPTVSFSAPAVTAQSAVAVVATAPAPTATATPPSPVAASRVSSKKPVQRTGVKSASNAAPTSTPTSTAASTPVTAAERYGWRAPKYSTDFTSLAALSSWYLYDSVGHAGNGTRSPNAISFADNVMTITGDSAGQSEGIASSTGQKYGAWEVRVRAPAGAADYDPVVLLWPDAENWPRGGEIDFMEIYRDPTRQNVGATLHYSAKNKQVGGNVTIDATQWHNYAVSWTPTAITVYVDGTPFYRTTNKAVFPPGSMHLCIQLDAVGTDFSPGAQMQVAWARQYSLTAIS